MRMIIGGAFQGKGAYARQQYPDIAWIDGTSCSLEELYNAQGIIKFHEYLKRVMQVDETLLSVISDRLMKENPEIIIISEEIGCGLVPVDAFERRYREQAGRICTQLAAVCDRVDRVVCGIGMSIKNECTENNSRCEALQDKDVNITLERIGPADIERRSFEIITEELGDTKLIPGTEAIVKRCIHTSADFEYAHSLFFSEDAVRKAQDAIRSGASIVTDTQMGRSGINKRKLAEYGGQVYCFMSDEDVAQIALNNGTTRATASMDKAAALNERLIFAIGNAPTALVRLYELIEAGIIRPELIIGVPVGFVNVVQSKELILSLPDTPYIVAKGRKGGSNIAACICNALLYTME